MKILSEKSILKFLPKELKVDQLLIFDSIRITFEIIEHNYECLEEKLLFLSNENNRKEKISSVFNYAWGIIDNTSRFIKLYQKLPSDSNYEVLDTVKHINSFRNTIQHLHERIDESLMKNRAPFYGILTWYHKNLETSEIIPTTLISGIEYGPKFEYKIPELSESKNEINDIWIQTVNKNKVIRTNLSELMEELRKICELNENKLQGFCNEKGTSTL